MLPITYGGNALLTRVALVRGLSPVVFVVSRQAIATLFISPFSFLSLWYACIYIHLCICSSPCIRYYTFFSSYELNRDINKNVKKKQDDGESECVNVRSLRGVAKIIGTGICAGGAMAMTLLKGSQLLNSTKGDDDDTWFLLLSTCNFGSSFSKIRWQAPISENCPDHLYTSSWMCLLATVSSATVAVIFGRRDLGSWKLDSFLKLSSCLYSGITVAISFFVQAWCVFLTQKH
ncbi:PREDICTED: LOW QUALITY PROTEIN: WAT1-related protein At4g28040 [Tarenaya hassleriana]|uniref:LOW QUALITY PROTEIN: WAT1-related protein At4g28040 n=1 Tax=Tarenaya hassleriana TaxID=28532 RepID=UPI0008FD2E49|nr:PREDICTED: LOW QUALITY PROTEIN: WAT1-related protein At4g28040 [Tarenaya hassleriana]